MSRSTTWGSIEQAGCETLLLERELNNLLPEARNLIFLHALGDVLARPGLTCPRGLAGVGNRAGGGAGKGYLVVVGKLDVLLERLAGASSIDACR